MSVGHVARGVEEAGIPTVSVFVRAFRHVAEVMRLPRTVITQHPMGRPLGGAHDRHRQLATVRAALELLETASTGVAIIDLDEPWRPGTVDS